MAGGGGREAWRVGSWGKRCQGTGSKKKKERKKKSINTLCKIFHNVFIAHLFKWMYTDEWYGTKDMPMLRQSVKTKESDQISQGDTKWKRFCGSSEKIYVVVGDCPPSWASVVETELSRKENFSIYQSLCIAVVTDRGWEDLRRDRKIYLCKCRYVCMYL